MPDDSRPNPEPPHVESVEPPASEDKQPDDEIGDFINRHVFEKDSVFNEG